MSFGQHMAWSGRHAMHMFIYAIQPTRWKKMAKPIYRSYVIFLVESTGVITFLVTRILKQIV